MKKQTKMACVILAFAAILGGCKKSDALKSDSEILSKGNSKLVAGDAKWDLLGHGYDVTGELFERENASKVSIIDVNRFYADYPNRIPTPTDTKGGYRVYYGATAYDYVNDVNKKQTFGITGTGGDSKGEDLYGSANFSLTNDKQNTYTYSSKYSYSTYESWFRIKSIDFTDDVTPELLKNYLTPDFIAYLSNHSAEEVVTTYGTHILLGIDIGGRIKYDYKGGVVKETTYERKLRAIKAGFSIGIAKIFSVDLSSDITKEEKTTISNETTDKLFVGTFYGGTNSGTSFSGDPLGNTSISVNLVSWQQSINVNNASLIGINRSVPIYEFITDPVKKGLVKAAVEKYIKDRQVKDLGEVPIYVYNNLVVKDHYFTPDNQPTIGGGGYANEGIAFYAFSKPTTGAVPIYVYNNVSAKDHYFTPDNQPTIGGGAYVREGIAFYAYPSSAAGRIPVVVYNNASVKDHYWSTVNAPTIGGGGYVREGISFYVPN